MARHNAGLRLLTNPAIFRRGSLFWEDQEGSASLTASC